MRVVSRGWLGSPSKYVDTRTKEQIAKEYYQNQCRILRNIWSRAENRWAWAVSDEILEYLRISKYVHKLKGSDIYDIRVEFGKTDKNTPDEVHKDLLLRLLEKRGYPVQTLPAYRERARATMPSL